MKSVIYNINDILFLERMNFFLNEIFHRKKNNNYFKKRINLIGINQIVDQIQSL